MSDLIEILTEIDVDLSGNAHPRPTPGSKVEALLGAVGDPSRAWVVIDGAAHLRLAVTARALGHRVYTLFVDDMAKEHPHVGPCVISPKEDGVFLRYFGVEHGENIGVVLSTDADLARLGDHLKRVFNVEDDDKRTYFFRFYDPRVLKPFLDASAPHEREEFFGPIVTCVAEDDDGFVIHTP